MGFAILPVVASATLLKMCHSVNHMRFTKMSRDEMSFLQKKKKKVTVSEQYGILKRFNSRVRVEFFWPIIHRH